MSNCGKPLLLVILDGWGMPEHTEYDATTLAKTPVFDALWANNPHTQLSASGLDVGLPAGQMGNSEVGHTNIGAGRVIYQDLTYISRQIEQGEFFRNPALTAVCDHCAEEGKALHLLGLLSDGGIHSHLSHVLALLELARQRGVERLYLHAFTDGRDTLKKVAENYIIAAEAKMAELGLGQIATVCGRFYAMDRDKRWDRVQAAYEALVCGKAGHQAASAVDAVRAAYEREESDEFIAPTVITDAMGQPVATIDDGDGVIFFNFRSDRAREISHALTDAEFDGFPRCKAPQLHYVCMTSYDATLTNVSIAYPPELPQQTLAQVVAQAGLKQLRIAETEKYAHVTFFFNGGTEEVQPGEDRLLIPSPKVKTYDLQPQMSAPEVTAALLEQIAADKYDLIILNYANPDMVGHTGSIPAVITALEAVDGLLGQVIDAVSAKGGTAIITADHGNAERMIDPATGLPMTAHTSNPVPLILVGSGAEGKALRDGGRLCDIAPTLLELLGLPQPAEMTGQSLLC